MSLWCFDAKPCCIKFISKYETQATRIHYIEQSKCQEKFFKKSILHFSVMIGPEAG